MLKHPTFHPFKSSVPGSLIHLGIIFALFMILLFASIWLARYLIPRFAQDIRKNTMAQVHFINTGHGDAILIREAGFNILIDAGGVETGVAAYLRNQRVDTIHILLATHPHADHIGGMPDVVGQFPVNKFIDPGITHEGIHYTNLLEMIERLDIPYLTGRKGMAWDLGRNSKLEIIHPHTTKELSTHNASLVTKLRLGRVSFLFAADIEREAENILLQTPGNLRSQIMKVANHGDNSSTQSAFLRAVRPELAIIMCGANGPADLPHSHTLAKLRAAATRIYHTDEYGHIIIETDGRSYNVIIQGKIHVMPVDLNTASLEELMRIVHIGQGRAEQIINLRPLEAIDDLLQIDGIGPRRLEDIKKQNKAMID